MLKRPLVVVNVFDDSVEVEGHEWVLQSVTMTEDTIWPLATARVARTAKAAFTSML